MRREVLKLKPKKVSEDKAEYRVSVRAEPGADDLWFVWRKGTKPKFRHATGESAHAEAKRLSLVHPGTKFCVLHIEAVYCEPPLT